MCSEPDCFFAKGQGFRSSDELDRHMASAHQRLVLAAPVSSPGDLGSAGLAVLKTQDRGRLLEHSIIQGRIDVIRQLMQQSALEDFFKDARNRYHRWMHFRRLFCSAAFYSSPEVLSWLIGILGSSKGRSEDGDRCYTMERALHDAIAAQNLPNIHLLLSQGVDIMSSDRLEVGRASQCPSHLTFYSDIDTPALVRALQQWSKELMEFLVKDCGVKIPKKPPRHLGRMFAPTLLVGASLGELRRRFDEVEPYLEAWGNPFKDSVYHACQMTSKKYGSSSPFVRICLENGGDPNAAPLTVQPLYLAVRAGDAETVKLLLQHGADPSLCRVTKVRADLEKMGGMRKVEQYFGLKWKCIVERIQAGEDLRPART
jgi:hypothetical protein